MTSAPPESSAAACVHERLIRDAAEYVPPTSSEIVPFNSLQRLFARSFCIARAASRLSECMSASPRSLTTSRCAWRASSSFDEFRNDCPVMKATQERIIRSRSAESIPHVQSGVGTAVGIDVAFQTAGGLAWRTVWSADIGSGSYSVDGLRASWEEPLDVVAVRLTSAPPNGPTFTGWRTARLYFGRKVPAGSVSVRSASTLEAIVGEAMHVAANQLHVSGGEAVDLHGAALSVAGETLDVRTSSGLNAATGKLQLDVQETLDVFAAGAASITTDELETNVRTDAALLAGGRLSAAAAAVDLDVSDGLSVHARAADIGLADSLPASVASTLSCQIGSRVAPPL